MSAPHPHSTADLALAPLLISIEQQISRFRTSRDLEFALALELNDDDRWYHGPAERADRLRQAATRGLVLHGWHVHPTSDLQGLAVERGGHRVCLMFGRRLADYVERGTPAGYFQPHPAAGAAH